MSLLAFLSFAIDKRLSKKEGRARIPEIVLLSMADFGGGLGALGGMYLFRHKTIFKTKYHFILSVWLAAVIQIALAMYMCIIIYK
ncbi:MAG: DUF1294 domain-containing protein [Clostridia bacterium]|nr:DUF1294 domain-containing protein [Clostridia bacterium]